MTEKLNFRQEKALETKNKLINTAIALFVEKGIDRTSIKDITNKAGVATGTFYVHFDSKLDLLFDYFAILENRFVDRLNIYENYNTWDGIKNYFELNFEIVESLGVDIAAESIIKIMKSKNREGYYRPSFTDSLTQVINKGIETGEIEPKISLQELIELISNFYDGLLLEWCVYDGSFDLRKKTLSKMRLIYDHMLAK